MQIVVCTYLGTQYNVFFCGNGVYDEILMSIEMIMKY